MYKNDIYISNKIYWSFIKLCLFIIFNTVYYYICILNHYAYVQQIYFIYQ